MDNNVIISKRIDQLNSFCKSVVPSDKYNVLKAAYEVSEEQLQLKGDPFTTYDIIYHMYTTSFKRMDEIQFRIAAMLYKWICTKVLYYFDLELTSNFRSLSWDDLKEYPVSLFNTIPIDSFAIFLNDGIMVNDQFYDTLFVVDDKKIGASITHNTAGVQFLLWRSGTFITRPFGFMNIEPTVGFDMTIDNLLDANAQEFKWTGQYVTTFKQLLVYVLPYLFYLASKNAEICQSVENKKVYKPFKFEPKHKYREVKTLVCGESYGNRIRKFKKEQAVRKSSGEGPMHAPHVRRAHYHRYWVGGGDDRHIEIRWVEQTYIHKDLVDDTLRSTGVKL